MLVYDQFRDRGTSDDDRNSAKQASAGRAECEFTERCHVTVLKGRRFENFGSGDTGSVERIDHDARICHVLFEGKAVTTPVAMRHLRVAPRPSEPQAEKICAPADHPQVDFGDDTLASRARRPHPCFVSQDDELFPQAALAPHQVTYSNPEPVAVPESWPESRGATGMTIQSDQRSASPSLLELAGFASTDSEDLFTVVATQQKWPSRKRVDVRHMQRVPVEVETASSSRAKVDDSSGSTHEVALVFMDSSEGFAAGLAAITRGIGNIHATPSISKQSPISAIWGRPALMHDMPHLDAFGAAMHGMDHLHAAHGEYFRSPHLGVPHAMHGFGDDYLGNMSRGHMPCSSPRSGVPPALTPPSLTVGNDLLSSHPTTPVSARRPLGIGQLQPNAQPFPNLWQPQQLTPPLSCGVQGNKPGHGHVRQLSPPRNILENLPGLPNLLEYRHPMSMH